MARPFLGLLRLLWQRTGADLPSICTDLGRAQRCAGALGAAVDRPIHGASASLAAAPLYRTLSGRLRTDKFHSASDGFYVGFAVVQE